MKIGPSLQVGSADLTVEFSSDGSSVLTYGAGKPAQLWDAATGEARAFPLGQPSRDGVWAVAIQPDGRIVQVVSAGNSGNVVRFRDGTTGKFIGPPLTHRGHIYQPVFSRDGRILLTPSDDGTARLWDAANGQPIGLPLRHPGGIRTAAFSPDGRTILTGCFDGTAQLWDTATRQPIGLSMIHESEVRAVAFGPDGKTVLTQCQDREARLWDAATAQFIRALSHQGGIQAVAFSPDGKTILTGSLDGTARLWDANPGQPLGQVLEIPSTDFVASVSPDGKVLASFAQEPAQHQQYAQLWNATTRQPIARIPQPGGNRQTLFSPDGKVVLTTTFNQTAQLWDATTGIALGLPLPIPGEYHAATPGPGGKAVLFGGKDLTVWICDAATRAVRGRTPPLGGVAYGLGFSSDGKTVFTGLVNGEVRLWDAATLTPLGDSIPQPGGAIGGGSFGHDGRSLWIECEDGSVWLWDLATRKPLFPPLRHHGPIWSQAVSLDAKTIVTGSKDKTARLWDIATGQPIGAILRHPGRVRSVAFLDDGKTLFTCIGSVSRLFPIPPELPDELERVATWVEVITGLTLDKQQGLVQVLDNAAWLSRRARLMHLGGSPETGPDQRLDPILFGPDPTARARSFIDRNQWDAAEAAFDEAMRARPFNMQILVERGNLYAKRGLWSEAAAFYAATVRKYPDVAPLHEQVAVTRLLAGDLPGYRSACAAMVERFKPVDDSTAAVRVAYTCSLAPEAVTDLAGLIAVSERSTRSVASNERVVGAVLFRAGRLEDALKRFDLAHKVYQPRAWDWLFLAMIHGRLGRPDQARQMLAQADQWVANADQSRRGADGDKQQGWSDEYEKPTILLLRREAEAMVRSDPEEPDHPVAHGASGPPSGAIR
jgi:WD40 repeat protein/tetratricopeptide (TPR) repeat protein